MTRIAFIGLGMMGRPMAECLIAAGREVRVSDANTSLANEFGSAWASNPAEAATGADLVITMLPNGQIVRDVMFGAGQVASVLSPGAILLDTSSSDAGGTIELGNELAQSGIRMVDAPVSGGVGLAREGKLAIMVGCGDDALFTIVEPILQDLAGRIVRVGGLGTGHAAKAINNAIAACIFAVTAEGLALGERFGLNPEVLLDVLNSSTGRSAVSEGVFRTQVLTKNYAQGFALGLMAKDVGLAEALRKNIGANMPMLQQTNNQWGEALAELGALADFTAFHAFVENRLGGGK